MHITTKVDTTLCDTVCQWLATGRWFSLGNIVENGVKHYKPKQDRMFRNSCLPCTLYNPALRSLVTNSVYSLIWSKEIKRIILLGTCFESVIMVFFPIILFTPAFFVICNGDRVLAMYNHSACIVLNVICFQNELFC